LTPLINKNGEKNGIIILSLNANYILDVIATAKSVDTKKDVQKYYLLNETGDYLFIGDKTKRWGSQLGHDFNFKRDYPNIIELFKDKDEATFIKNGKIFSMHKIYPDKIENRYRFWYLVTVIDEDKALSSLDTFINIFFLILFVVLGLGLFFINSYISKLMNPLTKVTSVLKALSLGKIQKKQIEYKADDEIGQIVNSSAILVDAIETTIIQAEAVASGDFTKELVLLSKNDALGIALKDMTKRLQEITKLSTSLSSGDYDVNIVARSNDDKLGLALIEMVDYLKGITSVTESIAVGELDVKYITKGNKDRLGHAILQMIKYLKTILQQANAISHEKFENSIHVKSKNDELGLALVAMTDILRNSSTKNKNEIFFSEGVGEFSDKINGINDINVLAKEAITTACRYIKASSGVVYTFEKEKKELNLIASFAYTSRNDLSNKFKLGEGIVGQVGLEKEPILLKNIKDEEFEVHSGTTLAKVKEVYAFPLIHEGELFGVAEIMSFDSFNDIYKDYLAKASSLFATALFTATQNIKIKELLEKSQQAFEELQTQSEELQESNVQMEEQQQQLTLQSSELREKNDNLAKAKKEINQRADDLEKASKYKSEFLANMSHELRTPLNSIILLSKLLSQNQEKTLSKTDIEKSSVINRAGNDLLLLINDILDLSKIESGNMELVNEKVHSSEILEDLKGLFESVAKEKKLKFMINDNFNAEFSIDKVKLSQVLKNLLSNAFKFTKKGSVAIDVDSTKDNIIFKITDTGIGIPADKLETIFEAFKQVDGSISREFGGTGLGLSISKTMVDLFGGSIDIESQLGVGTSFIITLPLKTVQQVPHAKEIPHAKNIPHAKVEKKKTESNSIILEDDESLFTENELSGKNILIVDDDSRNIFTLTSILESMDAEVYSAFNGEEAIATLEENSGIDLILMDIMMPTMDGLDAIKRIKADDKLKKIPIIAVTAKTMPEDKQTCLDAGADDYLPKPLEPNAFISMLKAWIK
jgi:signal transduction histidine kinase/ActR/RegA family two-component response regulator